MLPGESIEESQEQHLGNDEFKGSSFVSIYSANAAMRIKHDAPLRPETWANICEPSGRIDGNESQFSRVMSSELRKCLSLEPQSLSFQARTNFSSCYRSTGILLILYLFGLFRFCFISHVIFSIFYCCGSLTHLTIMDSSYLY